MVPLNKYSLLEAKLSLCDQLGHRSENTDQGGRLSVSNQCPSVVLSWVGRGGRSNTRLCVANRSPQAGLTHTRVLVSHHVQPVGSPAAGLCGPRMACGSLVDSGVLMIREARPLGSKGKSVEVSLWDSGSFLTIPFREPTWRVDSCGC